MLKEILLARGTAHYYALEQLFRNVPPHVTPASRPPKRRLRRALAWTLSKSGRALSAAGEKLRPTTAPDTAKLQGCG